MGDDERKYEERAMLYRTFLGGLFLGVLLSAMMQPTRTSTTKEFEEHVACVERGGVFVQHHHLMRCVMPKSAQ